jgi:trans-aconitate 2-methyltransferase
VQVRAAGPKGQVTIWFLQVNSWSQSAPTLSQVTVRWDPDQYLRYETERERPFGELLARVVHPGPREIVDLGCGPGTTTVRLLDRWPGAHILGVDSSAEMIARAEALAVPGRLQFRQGDLREWSPDQPVDILMTSATLQWVPGHEFLFPHFVESLAPGGVFAFQVPGNFGEPSHTLLYELAQSDRWEAQLGHLVRPAPVLEPSAYLSLLLEAGAQADVWETTYFQVFHDADAVLEWVRGTALRPFLAALEIPDEAGEFVRAYGAVLRAAYPRDSEGRTVFPFRRIFAVAAVPAVTTPGEPQQEP